MDFLPFGPEIRTVDEGLRVEIRSVDEQLRAEIRAGSQETQALARSLNEETRTHMLVLHEHLLERIRRLGEAPAFSRPGSTPRGGRKRKSPGGKKR